MMLTAPLLILILSQIEKIEAYSRQIQRGPKRELSAASDPRVRKDLIKNILKWSDSLYCELVPDPNSTFTLQVTSKMGCDMEVYEDMKQLTSKPTSSKLVEGILKKYFASEIGQALISTMKKKLGIQKSAVMKAINKIWLHVRGKSSHALQTTFYNTYISDDVKGGWVTINDWYGISIAFEREKYTLIKVSSEPYIQNKLYKVETIVMKPGGKMDLILTGLVGLHPYITLTMYTWCVWSGNEICEFELPKSKKTIDVFMKFDEDSELIQAKYA